MKTKIETFFANIYTFTIAMLYVKTGTESTIMVNQTSTFKREQFDVTSLKHLIIKVANSFGSELSCDCKMSR